MHLKDLFSDEEIASGPLSHLPKLQGFGHNAKSEPVPFNPPPISTGQQTTPYVFQNPSPQTSPQLSFESPSLQSSAPLSYQFSNQQPYQAFAETLSQTQPEFSFDDMSFLDTMPVADPNPGSWGGWNGGMSDLDLSFGTGGTGGFDSNGNWDSNGFDMLGGLFFGGDGGNGF